MPQSAVAPYFFTRYVKQAGTLLHPSAVPWHVKTRGHGIECSTRVPFSEMWVKIEDWPTLQEHPVFSLYAHAMPLSRETLLPNFPCRHKENVKFVCSNARSAEGIAFFPETWDNIQNGGMLHFAMCLHSAKKQAL